MTILIPTTGPGVALWAVWSQWKGVPSKTLHYISPFLSGPLPLHHTWFVPSWVFFTAEVISLALRGVLELMTFSARSLVILQHSRSIGMSVQMKKSNVFKFHVTFTKLLSNTHDTHHLFNCSHICTHIVTPDLWTDTAGVIALLAGGPQAEHLTPPLSKGHGSG